MRLQLHLQRIELSLRDPQSCFGKLSLEPGDLERFVLMTSIVVDKLAEQQNRAVAHEPGRQIEQKKIRVQSLQRRQPLICGYVQQPADQQVNRAVSRGNKQTGKDMHQSVHDPLSALQRELSRYPEYKRRESCPDEPVGQLPDKHLQKAWLFLEYRDVVIGEQIVGQRERQTYKRPADQNCRPQ